MWYDSHHLYANLPTWLAANTAIWLFWRNINKMELIWIGLLYWYFHLSKGPEYLFHHCTHTPFSLSLSLSLTHTCSWINIWYGPFGSRGWSWLLCSAIFFPAAFHQCLPLTCDLTSSPLFRSSRSIAVIQNGHSHSMQLDSYLVLENLPIFLHVLSKDLENH